MLQGHKKPHATKQRFLLKYEEKTKKTINPIVDNRYYINYLITDQRKKIENDGERRLEFVIVNNQLS